MEANSSSDNTIVITGIGCINALGHNYKQFSENLITSMNGIAPISLFDKNKVTAQFAAEIKAYEPDDHFRDSRQLNFLDRFSQIAIVSAREAIAQAGLNNDDLTNETAILCGTGIGGQTTLDENYRRLYADHAKRLRPFVLPKLIPSAGASSISIDLGVRGPSIGVSSACSSSGHAIAMGIMMLRSGQCEFALCGGAEAVINEGCVKVWEAMRVLSKDYCRPFSKNRGGVILGEGAANLVLETKTHAIERSANILAELVGFGMSSDANHVVAPTIEGPISAMRKALKNANLDHRSIDYINAHGSGTEQNDIIETAAIREVFNDHSNALLVSSTKSMLGHTLGAASVIESAATICALQQQIAPATISYQAPDPNCDLNYVANAAQKHSIDYAMSNSFAFGGLNVSLIFKQFK